MSRQVRIIKADGEHEFFSPEKLDLSLQKVGADPLTRQKIVAHVEKEIMDDMSTTDIYRHAFNLLHDFQKHAALRYSLRRALVGFGPTGFPFERFIGEIFRVKGYTVETGKIVQGKCVPHEVDLIAYDSAKLIMGEVKFHNELGYKSDLKVALYVKARMDDLKQAKFTYGGKHRSLDEGWLITNTKFTETAIQYGECVGMKMVGWNYPQKGENLEYLIESNNLHPLSCLNSLTVAQKQELFARDIVLCKTLKDNISVLDEIGVKKIQVSGVLDELSLLSK